MCRRLRSEHRLLSPERVLSHGKFEEFHRREDKSLFWMAWVCGASQPDSDFIDQDISADMIILQAWVDDRYRMFGLCGCSSSSM
jgi:hypothetical protein